MKHGMFIPALCILSLISGCGHSVLVESEVTGFAIKVPIGEGGSLGVTLGSSKLTTATVRGGTTLETTSSAGGGIFSGDGGLNRITTFKTNAQLNEGNLRDVLLSDKVPDEAKVILASNLCIAAKAPKVAQTVLQTPTTTIHTGEATASNSVASLNRISGLDKVVDTVPAVVGVIPETVKPVVDGAVTVTTNVVDEVIGTVTEITGQVTDSANNLVDDASKVVKDIKWITIFKGVALAALAILALWFMYFKMFAKSATSARPAPVFRPVDPDQIVDTPPEDPPTPTDTPEEPPTEPPAEAPKPIKKKEEETVEGNQSEQQPKVPWYKKVITFFSVCYALFLRIPPETRAKILNSIKTFVTEWIQKKREEKKNKESK